METNTDKVLETIRIARQSYPNCSDTQIMTALSEAIYTIEAIIGQKALLLSVFKSSDERQEKRIAAAEYSLKVYDPKEQADYWVLYPPDPENKG